MAPSQHEPTKPFGVAEIDGQQRALSARAAWELVRSAPKKYEGLLFYWPWDEKNKHPMRPRNNGKRARSEKTEFVMAYLPGYCPAHPGVGESLSHYKSNECLARVGESDLELHAGQKVYESPVRLSNHIRECPIGNRRIDVLAVVEAEVPEVQALLRSSFVAFEICYTHESEKEKPQELAERFISVLEIPMDYELAEDATLEEIRSFEDRVVGDLRRKISAVLLPAKDPAQKLAEAHRAEIESAKNRIYNLGEDKRRFFDQVNEADAEKKQLKELLEKAEAKADKLESERTLTRLWRKLIG